MQRKLITPTNTLIENIAGQLAATFWEVGKAQGMTSKHKTARLYAKHNLEKFIPKAVDVCLEMLKPTSNITDEARMQIYQALMERHNDPELCEILPNVDVNKLIELADLKEKNKIIEINTKPVKKTVLHNG